MQLPPAYAKSFNIFHSSRLKRYQGEFQPPIQREDGSYQVEAILAHRYLNDRRQYRVKWTGYPDEQNTWEFADDLIDAIELLQAYWTKKRLRPDPSLVSSQ